MINLLDILPDGYLSIYLSYQLSQKLLEEIDNLNPDCQEVISLAKEYLDNPETFLKDSQVEALSKKFLHSNHEIDLSSNSFHWIIHCLKYVLKKEYSVGLLFNIQAATGISFQVSNKKDIKTCIHNLILENFNFILEYKIKNNQAFSSCEKLMEYLNIEQKKILIYNLDILDNSELKNQFPYVNIK